MSIFDKLAGAFGYKNPADAAMPYLEQIPGAISGYYDPYIQAGQQALPQLQQQLAALLSSPGQVLGGIGADFQQSPGYEFSVNQQVDAAKRAAAAGGMGGSPAAQWDAMQRAEQLAGTDYYNYLDRALGLYGTGLSGTQGLSTQGLQAGQSFADQLASVLGSQAQLAYSGQQGQNQAAGGILGGLGSIGGAIAGGPIGAAIGSKIFGKSSPMAGGFL
jgi:hypothetical protein